MMTRVWVEGRGVVLEEPTVVARLAKSRTRSKKEKDQLVASGQKAWEMWLKEPSQVEVVFPIRAGAIVDYQALGWWIGEVMRAVVAIPAREPKWLKTEVHIVSSVGGSEVNERAISRLWREAGVGEVRWYDMFAMLGRGVYGKENFKARLIVDIGKDTTRGAYVTESGVVVERTLPLGGVAMSEALVGFVRMKYGIALGFRQADRIRIKAGGIVRGWNLTERSPITVKVGQAEVVEAIAPVVMRIGGLIREIIGELPLEIAEDLVSEGVVLSGGGAGQIGLKTMLMEELGLGVAVSEELERTAIRGLAVLVWGEDAK